MAVNGKLAAGAVGSALHYSLVPQVKRRVDAGEELRNMRTMTQAEYRQFLMTGTRTAKVATVRPDGRPHIAPVWFVLDGDDLVFTTDETSVKGRDLKRDSRVSLCVDEEIAPCAYVLIEGAATLSDDLAELRNWATRIGGRYMGADRAEEFGARDGVPGELLVRVTPHKIIARADIAGY